MTTQPYPNTPTGATVGDLAAALVATRASQGTNQKLLGCNLALPCVKLKTPLLDESRRPRWAATDQWLAANPGALQKAGATATAPEIAPATAPASVAAAAPIEATVPTEMQCAAQGEPAEWRWADHTRWVRPVKEVDTYEAGEHSSSLLALAGRIEQQQLHTDLVQRFLPGLDAALLRKLADDPRVCATLDFNDAMGALHVAADHVARGLCDAAVPVDRLDVQRAGAWLGRLHPVIPPNAVVIKLKPHENPERLRGKAPGLPTDEQGARWKLIPWRPGPWASLAARDQGLRFAVNAGGNVGLRLGKGDDGHSLVAFDFDTEVATTCMLLKHARQFILTHCGKEAVQRFGRHGRGMLVLRTNQPMRKAVISFEDGQKIELLGEGQQIAFDGQHPSGTPYRTAPLLHDVAPTDLPELTEREVDELMGALRQMAETFGLRVASDTGVGTASPAQAVDPSELTGNLAEVKELLARIPPPDERSRWVQVMAALKGATLNNPGDGLELALRWSWGDSEAEVAETERVWLSIKPQTGIKELRHYAGLQSSRPEEVFVRVPEPIALAAQVDASAAFAAADAANQSRQRATDGADFLAKLDPAEISRLGATAFDVEPPPIEAIVSPLAIRGAVTLLSGDGGTGKSMFALGLAYEIAAGVPFLSHGPLQVNQRGRVLFLTAEETTSDLARRRSLWRKRAMQMSTNDADPVAQLRAGLKNVYVVPTTAATVTLFRSGKGATDALAELEALCQRIGDLDVLIVDPAGSYAAMDPTKDLGDFVMVLRALAARRNIAVILLHHISKGAANHAANTGADLTQHASLGSVMGVNSARVAANLQRMPKEAAASWGVSEADAHNFVGLNVPKANGTAPIITPLWFRNVDGVLVPANLVHRDKVEVKKETAEKDRARRDQRLMLALLRWCTGEYKSSAPPSHTTLVSILCARVGGDEKAVRNFLHSQVSRGLLVLDPSVKQSGNSRGGLRPGNLDLLRQEIAPPPQPTDSSELFNGSQESRGDRFQSGESGELGAIG